MQGKYNKTVIYQDSVYIIEESSLTGPHCDTLKNKNKMKSVPFGGFFARRGTEKGVCTSQGSTREREQETYIKRFIARNGLT